MMNKLMTLGLVLALAAGTFMAHSQPAEARRGAAIAAGIAAGIITLGVLGAASHARRGRYYYRDGGCYRGPRRCYRVGRRCWYNRFGDRICGRPRYRCRRPLICQ